MPDNSCSLSPQHQEDFKPGSHVGLPPRSRPPEDPSPSQPCLPVLAMLSSLPSLNLIYNVLLPVPCSYYYLHFACPPISLLFKFPTRLFENAPSARKPSQSHPVGNICFSCKLLLSFLARFYVAVKSSGYGVLALSFPSS